MRKIIFGKANKKAQVTIFIILGLLILTAAMVVIFINMNSKKAQIDEEFNRAISERPQFAKPIYLYVESCMQQLSKQAFIILGQNGGFIYSQIDPPVQGDFVNSQGVIYYGNILPYWNYVPTQTDQTAGFITKSLTNAGMPYLCKNTRPCMTTSPPGEDEKSVEGQIQRYIDENMKYCLDDFRAYTTQGYNITKEGEFKSEVLIQNTSQNVIIKAYFPISVNYGGASAKVDKYQSVLDFDFAALYKKLYRFVKEEAEGGFIEEHMLRLMDAYAYTNKIPSYKQFEFFTDKKKWSINNDIKPAIKNLLTQYVPQQKIMYTRNWENTVIPSNIEYGHPAEAHYRDMVFNVYNDTPMFMTDIYFEYDPDNFDFALWMPDSEYKSGDKIEQKPKLDDLTGIEFIDNLLSYIPMWELSTSYYVSYPVVVSFSEHNMFKDDANGDYNFVFAMESNIVNNEPVELGASSSFLSMSQTVLCDAQLKSVPVNMTVKDYLYDTPIANAKVIYTCAGRSCTIGETDSAGQLNELYPDCGGIPYITIDSKEYMLKRFEQKLKKGTNVDLDITLQPKIPHNYIVKKIKASSVEPWKNLHTTNIRLLTNKATNLTAKDTVTFQFVRNQTAGFTERGYSTAFGVEKGIYSSDPLKLINGTYRVMATLITYEDVYIPMEFARAGNETGPNRCKTIGKMSELAYMDEESHILGYGKLNFNFGDDSIQYDHYICRDEPDNTFWPNWGLVFLTPLAVTQITTKTQKDDCNEFVDNYLTKKLPKFSQAWDPINNKTVAIEDGILDAPGKIGSTIVDCFQNISNAVSACMASKSCGSPFDNDGNLKADYFVCMNYDYYKCIKDYNEGIDYQNYGACYFNHGFCNKYVRWYGADTNPTQSEVIPLYQMTNREYTACNLRSGYFSVGLDLGVYVNGSIGKRSDVNDDDFEGCVAVSGHVECSDDTTADEYVAADTNPKTIDGAEYRQFGLCLPGIADTFNNTNITSNATIKIQEINLTGKPILNGGFMANEATDAFWNYNVYNNERYKKNLTFYVIELNHIPLYYEDFAQQADIINYSAEIGPNLVKAFFP